MVRGQTHITQKYYNHIIILSTVFSASDYSPSDLFAEPPEAVACIVPGEVRQTHGHSMSAPQSDMADIELSEQKKNKEDQGPTVAMKKSFLCKLKEKSTMLKDLDGDKVHVLILFFLYCLQGIPLGLKDAIPLILTKKGIPYTDQATFSISGYPFSMKVKT